MKERQIRSLADLEFIPKAENVVFIGETGVGKSGLMMSLARKAVQNGYRALFIQAQDLFDEMYASIADRSSRKLLKSLANVDVLAIDELGYCNISTEQTNIFFKLMEERHRRKPTLITTNLKCGAPHFKFSTKPLRGSKTVLRRPVTNTVRLSGLRVHFGFFAKMQWLHVQRLYPTKGALYDTATPTNAGGHAGP